MMRKILVTAAVSGLMISAGLAQSTQSTQSPQAVQGGGDKFIASQSADQWVFSKFKGTDVVGPNDEAIGGVNDLLFDKSGKVFGVVVGVGGFLGIGQKNVAIDMSAFQPVPAPSVSTSAPVTGGSNDPTNIKLKVAWTKDELMKAPDFQYFKAPSDSAANAPRPSTNGMSQQRPAPGAPPTPQPR
jgi:hypothetical protein